MLYMDRRKALVIAIQTYMEGMAEIIGSEAGMHLVTLLPPGVDDVAVSRKAGQRGISVMPLSTCYSRALKRSGLILGYGGIGFRRIHDGIRTLSLCVSAEMG